MTTVLVLAALTLVVLHTWWQARRRGAPDPAVVARDVGVAIAVLLLLIEGSSFWVDFAWWKELGQAPTFWEFLRIRWLPQTAAAVIGIAALSLAFYTARRRAASPVARTRLFGGIGYIVALGLGSLLAVNLIDPWVIALYLGARDTHVYADPIFHKDLTFYLFRLPFFQMIFVWVAALLVCGLVLGGLTVALGSSAERLRQLRARVLAQAQGNPEPIPVFRGESEPLPLGAWLRTGAIVLLALFAIAQFFARYTLLYSSHRFLTGADFVDVRIGLPLLWVQIVGALVLAGLIAVARRPRRALMRRDRPLAPRWLPDDVPEWLPALAVITAVVLLLAPPALEELVRNAYVRPNELTLERPYIADHIAATRMAFGLEQSSHEEAFTPTATDSLDLSQYPDTANNIRLWDAAPFANNITQLQALRPYYAFPNVDVDRYPVAGQMRQVLLAARGLDTSLLPQTAQSWVNLRLQYTHGYGAVGALINSATPEGQPDLILKNAPPESSLPALDITRPELYFGEETANPVFVDTRQDEFDYPKGDDNSYTNYAGAAGVVMANPWLRLAVAIQQNDTNVLLTSYFTDRTRLLLHRQIVERVQTLAPFLTLDSDPYLVITPQGRMFWMLDAYTVSDQHPYAEPLTLGDQEINYIRNSVKITVDAYNGTVKFYVFDPTDPILAAYRNVFPDLFLPRAAMPAELAAHIRYPQMLFEAQAETYRLYHMQDPQVFYNKEDQWDIARQEILPEAGDGNESSQATAPYYVLLRLPGDTQAEFVLMLPFTSHNRDNLIAWLAARCDPDHYGQIVFYRLPKEQLVYGPLQIESRVDQDQTISKDLSLWNQQGSRVIRGTTLVLPVGGTFLYAEPIYIQATQAKLPELQKVVLAVGNRLVYSDTLAEAMAELAQPSGTAPAVPSAAPELPAGAKGRGGTVPPSTATAIIPRALLEQIEGHLARYRSLTAQGQFAQAGAELDAAQKLLQQALQPHQQ